MKKIIIIVTASLLIIFGVLGYLIYDNNKVVSTILLDINPSVKINLNKKEKVINVVALNDDAKKIVSDNLKGKKLEAAIETITENVVKEGFVEGQEVVVLLNSTGKINSNNVEKILETKFKEKKVECNTIIQETKKEASENSKKYDISESKAAYIEEIIENNEELKFEDLKDKSIKELNEINEEKKEVKEEPVTDPVVEEPKPVEPPIVEEPIIEPPVVETPAPSYSNPPSDPTDTSGVWCTWNEIDQQDLHTTMTNN